MSNNRTPPPLARMVINTHDLKGSVQILWAETFCSTLQALRPRSRGQAGDMTECESCLEIGQSPGWLTRGCPVLRRRGTAFLAIEKDKNAACLRLAEISDAIPIG